MDIVLIWAYSHYNMIAIYYKYFFHEMLSKHYILIAKIQKILLYKSSAFMLHGEGEEKFICVGLLDFHSIIK